MIRDKQKKVAIIYEGEKTEENLFKNIIQHFFADRADVLILTLPAAANLYMLWTKLREDHFETDVVGVLKEMNSDISERLTGMQAEDFSEIYLFFDYDGHQNNIPKKFAGKDVLKEMLETFHNETELGKLYISYPMVEAIREISVEIQDYKTFYLPLGECAFYRRRLEEYRIMVIFGILRKKCGILHVMPAENGHPLLSHIKKRKVIGIL